MPNVQSTDYVDYDDGKGSVVPALVAYVHGDGETLTLLPLTANGFGTPIVANYSEQGYTEKRTVDGIIRQHGWKERNKNAVSPYDWHTDAHRREVLQRDQEAKQSNNLINPAVSGTPSTPESTGVDTPQSINAPDKDIKTEDVTVHDANDGTLNTAPETGGTK